MTEEQRAEAHASLDTLLDAASAPPNAVGAPQANGAIINALAELVKVVGPLLIQLLPLFIKKS